MITIQRREMTKNDRYIYTMSRAARLLGVKESAIEFVYNCGDGQVLIGLFNDSIYLTEREFKVSYGQERKERSQGMKVTKRLDNDFSYTARNEDKQTAYKIDCFTDHIRCNCPDFEISTQVMNTNKVCCKHGYAVLGMLGFASLNDYVKAQKEKTNIKDIISNLDDLTKDDLTKLIEKYNLIDKESGNGNRWIGFGHPLNIMKEKVRKALSEKAS